MSRGLEPFRAMRKFTTEIYNAGKLYELESLLEDEYPEGMTETELNDFIWFEEDTWRDWLDMEEDEDEDEEEEEEDEDEDEEEE